MKLLLDSNVLVRLCHPTAHRDVQQWFRKLLERGDDAPEILISVLADYEVRRAFLDRGARASLDQLDQIEAVARSLPMTPEATRLAAELRSRLQDQGGGGLSDAHLIMVAQAELERAVLVTSDRRISALTNIVAKDWDAIDLGA